MHLHCSFYTTLVSNFKAMPTPTPNNIVLLQLNLIWLPPPSIADCLLSLSRALYYVPGSTAPNFPVLTQPDAIVRCRNNCSKSLQNHQRNSVATQAILATDATNKPAMQQKFKEKRDILKRLHCPLNMYDYKSRGHFLLEFGLRALSPCDPRLPWGSI